MTLECSNCGHESVYHIDKNKCYWSGIIKVCECRKFI
jgi:ribosomal protein L37E